MSLLKNITLSSALKPCVGCFASPAVAGMPGVCVVIRQLCGNHAVSTTFYHEKQRHGAPRLTEELRGQDLKYNVKTAAANLKRQGLRAKASRWFSLEQFENQNLA